MSKITFKELKGNTPGKDTRNKKPDFKGSVDAVNYKKAVMGRSKISSKKGTQRTAILD